MTTPLRHESNADAVSSDNDPVTIALPNMTLDENDDEFPADVVSDDDDGMNHNKKAAVGGKLSLATSAVDGTRSPDNVADATFEKEVVAIVSAARSADDADDAAAATTATTAATAADATKEEIHATDDAVTTAEEEPKTTPSAVVPASLTQTTNRWMEYEMSPDLQDESRAASAKALASATERAAGGEDDDEERIQYESFHRDGSSSVCDESNNEKNNDDSASASSSLRKIANLLVTGPLVALSGRLNGGGKKHAHSCRLEGSRAEAASSSSRSAGGVVVTEEHAWQANQRPHDFLLLGRIRRGLRSIWAAAQNLDRRHQVSAKIGGVLRRASEPAVQFERKHHWGRNTVQSISRGSRWVGERVVVRRRRQRAGRKVPKKATSDRDWAHDEEEESSGNSTTPNLAEMADEATEKANL